MMNRFPVLVSRLFCAASCLLVMLSCASLSLVRARDSEGGYALWSDLASGAPAVGFRIVNAYDRSRITADDAREGLTKRRARPAQISVCIRRLSPHSLPECDSPNMFVRIT